MIESTFQSAVYNVEEIMVYSADIYLLDCHNGGVAIQSNRNLGLCSRRVEKKGTHPVKILATPLPDWFSGEPPQHVCPLHLHQWQRDPDYVYQLYDLVLIIK